MALTQSAERAALYKLIDYVDEDPEARIPKIMDTIDKYTPASVFPTQRAAFRSAIDDRSNWYQLILKAFHLNPEVRRRLLKTFIVDANILAWPVQEKARDKYACNIPWAILLDPTSACNLRCTGCWAAEYGHALNLSYEDICSIIDQGRELGCHVYIYTGGEPLVRKDDLIRICEKYPDCAFLCFTNATLIDEAFCQDMIRVANFVPAISAEGNEHTTDERRGDGTYAKIERAMDLLRAHDLPFGISCCWTRANADAVATEQNMDWMIEKGALFCWYFHFMPVGRAASADLMPTPEQRERMYRFVREMRGVKPLFTLDFQNDGEFVGGCIAGGRRYLHINAAGDVEPCVFIHYANANIHDVSLLDALRSPLFMKYYQSQPFNTNHLRPCPMLENPDDLPRMVVETGARSTDLVEKETPEQLREKTAPAAAAWAPVAERLWADEADPLHETRQRWNEGQAETDVTRLARLGRDLRTQPEPQL
ncbi:radical SAM protein [Olsenella sp. An293]|uniref:radical SAM protein n=1 Tax=Olsenella sp. An293 TaxID=1965626 RepID=UPI000B381960|nr:radical SAM protein [Olsenella sp. An293]OUO32552.1 radical SAM protein [Olsenella sp. An293]